MRLFTSESIFNIESGKWEERFWIEGQLVDGDEYFFELEREKDLENEKLLKECEIEDDEDDFCDCPECTILRYVEEIQEITGGCPGCIEECLTRFFVDIVEHIIIENDDDRGNDNSKLN
jgi:hypothetical protein